MTFEILTLVSGCTCLYFRETALCCLVTTEYLGKAHCGSPVACELGFCLVDDELDCAWVLLWCAVRLWWRYIRRVESNKSFPSYVLL